MSSVQRYNSFTFKTLAGGMRTWLAANQITWDPVRRCPMSAPSTGPVETVLQPQPSTVAEPAPLPDHSRPLTKPRMLYVDNLRSVLISMVVLLHLAISRALAARRRPDLIAKCDHTMFRR